MKRQRLPAGSRSQPEAPQREHPPLERAADCGNQAMLEELGLARGAAPGLGAVDRTARAIMAASSGHDTRALYELYAKDATFSGPVFGEQDALGNLGKLSTEHDGTGAVIEYDPEYRTERLQDGTTRVSISWVADYTLLWADIHNEVVSHFVIDDDGRILSQVDEFDKARWLEQLLGFLPAGGREWIRRTLLTPYLEATLRGKGEALAREYAADGG